ncbi:MAG: nucleotide pyrophosphatase [Gemmatimonadetes bacterium]|nr:nucleotide pyrophosphatase [Gemmatimonadota bacterium]
MLTAIFFCADPAEAYIGPGAGFAFLSSFMVLFVTFLLAFVSILLWPIRFVWKLIFKKRPPKTDVDRVIVVGLDGFDPNQCKKFMAEGKLPHFQKLADQGTFDELQTVFPAMSPVAWSSFATGVDPSRHNQFDFLNRDPRTYLPDLASVFIGPVSRVLNIGKYKLPLGKPVVRLLRKSQPFWKILGEYGIFSHILRVPITFPPEKHNGLLLSAMCVPDIKGSQGTFTYYTTDESEVGAATGGVRRVVKRSGNVVEGDILGPSNSMTREEEELTVPFKVTIDDAKQSAVIDYNGEKIPLKQGEYSEWIRTPFSAGLGVKVWGLVRFYIMEMGEHFKLYVSPIQIDPEKPAMPISHPTFYSIYLSKLLGSFATLGFCEDTWGLNERVIDEDAFLKQTWITHEERERMLFHSMEQVKKGFLVCRFDGTDRVQHMFQRYLMDGHPANAKLDENAYRDEIEKLYVRMDEMMGRVMDKVKDDKKTVLMVMSDHGFAHFSRGVNLNSWLVENGYMVMKDGGKTCKDWFRGVDWEKTKAYSFGLVGIYLNIKGREGQGIVEAGEEAAALRQEIKEKLEALVDPKTGAKVMNDVFKTEEIYTGPYAQNGPDLLPAFDEHYRQSWEAAVGKAEPDVIIDNVKAWSGDHCLDWRIVPGVLFSSRKLARKNPGIMDMSASILDLFGIQRPAYMLGRSFFRVDSSDAGQTEKQSPPEEREVANA